jgi:ATP-dependent DNA ligase
MAKMSPTHAAGFVEPMQCLAVAKLPEGPDWKYEIKFDGYRALAIKIEGRVQLLSQQWDNFSRLCDPDFIVRLADRYEDTALTDGFTQSAMKRFRELRASSRSAKI